MPSVVLYWSQMSVQEDDIIKLEKNDAMMVRKMWNVSPEDMISAVEFRNRVQLDTK